MIHTSMSEIARPTQRVSKRPFHRTSVARLTYSSYMAAFHALLVYPDPKRIAVSDVYYECYGVIGLLQKFKPVEVLTLDPQDLAKLEPGDLYYIDTPYNRQVWPKTWPTTARLLPREESG
jgi:cystathionine beta-lyase/cystathionine gamma-synthase